MTRSVAVLILLAGTACSSRTQLVVALDSDLEVPEALDSFVVRIRPLGGIEESRQPLAIAEEGSLPRPGKYALPLSFGVSPPGDDSGAEVDLRIDVLDNQGKVKLTTRAVTGFIREKSLLLPIFIPHTCVGFQCKEDQTCRVGGCTDVRVNPLTLPEAQLGEELEAHFSAIDAGEPDASTSDAGSEDAEPAPVDTGYHDAEVDSGFVPDALPRDADTLVDTGTHDDAEVGPEDARETDTGVFPDSTVGSPDAQLEDAQVVDSGGDDAQVIDLGLPSDSGAPEASVMDLGVRDSAVLDAVADAGVPDSGDPCAGPELCDGLDNDCDLDYDEGACSGWIDHGGTVSNEIWDASGIHRVTSPLLIPSGVTLEIRAGALVKFQTGIRLQVDGTLRILGSQEAPVRIMSTSIRDPRNGGQRWGETHGRGRIEADHVHWMWGSAVIFGGVTQLTNSTIDDTQWQAEAGGTVRGSRIVGGGLSLQPTSEFEPCLLEESDIASALSVSGPCLVRRNTFTGEGTLLANGSGGSVSIEVYENSFNGSGDAVRFDGSAGVVTLRRNSFSAANQRHIVAGGRYVDARQNYFGAATNAQILAGIANLTKIYDNHDDFALGFVDVRDPLPGPYATQPLAPGVCSPLSLSMLAPEVFTDGSNAIPAASVAHEGFVSLVLRNEAGSDRLVSTWTSTSGEPIDALVELGSSLHHEARLAVSPSGTVVAAVIRSNQYGILVTRSIVESGMWWTAPEPLDPETHSDGLFEGVPSIATDGVGTWMVVFGQTGESLRIARSTDDGQTWSTRSLNVSGRSPQIAADGLGNWMIVYTRANPADEDVFALTSTTSGATFVDTGPINASADLDHVGVRTDDYEPALATDGNGTWVVAWGSSGRILASRSTDFGAHWTSPGLMSGLEGTPRYLGFDGQRWVAVLQHYLDSGARVGVVASEGVAQWMDRRLLGVANDGYSGYYPALASGPYGSLMTWARIDDSDGIPSFLESALIPPCTPP